MSLFDNATNEVLLKFLDKKAKDAEEEIATTGTLSEEHAIPLLLKSQFNHIAHLDAELTEFRKLVDRRFEQVDKRFEQVDKRFEEVDKRFDRVDKRFEQVDKRFEQVDRQFDRVDRRFEQVDNQLRHLGSRITQVFAGLSVGFTIIAFLIILFGFLK